MLIAGAVTLCVVSVACNVFAARWMAGNDALLLHVFTALAIGSGLVKLAGAVYLEREWQWSLAVVVGLALLMDVCWSLGFSHMTRELAAQPQIEASRRYTDAEKRADDARRALERLPAPGRPLAVARTDRDALDARGCELDRNKKLDRCRDVALADVAVAAAEEYEKTRRAYDVTAAALAAVQMPTTADPLAAAIGKAMRSVVASATDDHAKLAFAVLMMLLFELAPMFALPAALKPPKPQAVAPAPAPLEPSAPSNVVKLPNVVVPRAQVAVAPIKQSEGIVGTLQGLAAGELPDGITATATGLRFSQRALSRALGRNSATLNSQLKAAAAAGLITLAPDSRGTCVGFVCNVIPMRAP